MTGAPRFPGCRAVLLDWGGTLDADGLAWKERVALLLRAEGHAIPSERFDPAFYRADDALVGALGPTVSFRETARRLMEGLARGLAIEDGALIGRLATVFVDESLAVARRNRPLLEALARRYRLGIVSNFYGNLETVCEDCGIHDLFSTIMDSARVGWEKPDPRIFGRALEALAVGPAEAVFVGDSLPRDMAGARALGMPHVWLVAETGERRAACCPADPVVHSLKGLEELLL